MPRRLNIDWRTVSGFAGLLCLIIIIGLIGIAQIQDLSRMISALAKSDIPLQNAILEMKSKNSQYAMALRNYAFWKGARYLDAASVAQKLDPIRAASKDFDARLDFYASRGLAAPQKEWAAALRESERALRRLGGEIIATANKMEAAAPEARQALEASVNRLFMDFENRLFQIDLFLDDPVGLFNLERIDERLRAAQSRRAASTLFLTWSLVIGVACGIQTAYFIWRRGRKEQQHKELLCRAMIKVEEEERNHLSLQVHDQMGQDLSALKIFLGLIEQDVAAARAEWQEKMAKAKTIITSLLEKTHNISEMLRPPELDDLGLVESIATLLLRHEEMLGVKTRYARPQIQPPLAPEHCLILYRVVQEALTNIAKHAGAKNVEVALTQQGGDVFLRVADDGAGFDVAACARRPARRHEDKMRLGLRGLRERLELLGGTFSVTSRPGEGTRLEVVLPLPRA